MNAQYFVMTSPDVIETSGFCTIYCAFHGYQTTDSSTMQNSCGVPISNPSQLNENLIGSFIGDTNQCPIECATQDKTPNNDLVGDSMVNVIAHEMSESVTDPLFTGWYDSDFSENGDLCLWNFGAAQGKTKLLPNGSYYNVKFGGHPWMIQQIWVNAHGGYCALALDE